MSSATNPLAGWVGATGVNTPTGTPSPIGSSPGIPNTSTNLNNPFGIGNYGGGAQSGNLAFSALQQELMRNALIGPFASAMWGTASPAASYYQQLMNLGSPYYQQQQQQSFTQGTQQGQNAASLARQQLGSQGFGFTPSGAEAATIGGMGQANAASLSANYLQNLFNNEQLQLAGASGLSQIAQMFNPAQLTGQSTTPGSQAQNSFAQDLTGIGSLFSGAGSNGSGGFTL